MTQCHKITMNLAIVEQRERNNEMRYCGFAYGGIIDVYNMDSAEWFDNPYDALLNANKKWN